MAPRSATTMKLALLIAVLGVSITLAGKYTTNLNEESLKIAMETLGETEEIRDKSIDEIKQWIEESKDEFVGRTDPTWILSFLRINKFKIDRTKDYIKNYMRFVTSAPEWFENRDPTNPDMKRLIKIGMYLPLRGLDKKGRLVILLRMASYNPSKYDLTQMMKVAVMIQDILNKENEDTAVKGVVLATDFEGFTLNHAIQLTPNLLQKVGLVWQAYNFQTSNVDVIHVPEYVNIAVTLFKSFLTPKYRKKITVHPAGVDLVHLLPREILPEEYGGTAGPVKDLIKYWVDKCVENKDWLIESEKYKYIGES